MCNTVYVHNKELNFVNITCNAILSSFVNILYPLIYKNAHIAVYCKI